MVPAIAAGRPETIPAKIIIDIPLPIPRSVTCSPNHIKKSVPATRVDTQVTLKAVPGSMTSFIPAAVCCSNIIETPTA